MLNKIELVEEEETSSFPCNEKQCWEAMDTFNYDYTIIHSKGRATNRSILQFCLAFRHQCVYISSVNSSEAIKCGGIQW